MRWSTKSSHVCPETAATTFPRSEEHQVLVLPRAAKAPGRLQVADASDDLEAVVRPSGPDRVTAGEAAPMGEKVPDGELPGRVGIVHLEPRYVVDHPVVPAQAAFVDQKSQRGRGERLRCRAHGEEGVLVHGCSARDVTHPVAARVNNLAIPDHGEGQTRDAPRFHSRRDVVVQPLERRWLCRGRRRENAQEDEGPGKSSPRARTAIAPPAAAKKWSPGASPLSVLARTNPRVASHG